MGTRASAFTVGQSRGFAVVAELPGSCWASLCCPCSVICRQPGRAPRCAGLGLRRTAWGTYGPGSDRPRGPSTGCYWPVLDIRSPPDSLWEESVHLPMSRKATLQSCNVNVNNANKSYSVKKHVSRGVRKVDLECSVPRRARGRAPSLGQDAELGEPHTTRHRGVNPDDSTPP